MDAIKSAVEPRNTFLKMMTALPSVLLVIVLKSDQKLLEQDLTWTNLVLVMENDPRSKINNLYSHMELPPVDVLHIEYEYEIMDEELVQMLQDRINRSLKATFAL